MRRILGTCLLVGVLVALQGGTRSHADDAELGKKQRVVTGCVQDLAAVNKPAALRVRLKRSDGSLTPWARAKGPWVSLVLQAAYLDERPVTAILKVNGNFLEITRALLRRDAKKCVASAPSGTRLDPSSGTTRAADEAATRLVAGEPCLWPGSMGGSRRASQLLEEIRSLAVLDAAEAPGNIGAGDLTAIVQLTRDIEVLGPAFVQANDWPWPIVSLRGIWGKAVYASRRDGSGSNPPAAEWAEVKLALDDLITLASTAPDGVAYHATFEPFSWPYGSYDFAPPEFLLLSIASLGEQAFDAGTLDEVQFLQLLTELDRCRDPELRSHKAPNAPVCEMSWPRPYDGLVGIWGKALFAQGAVPQNPSARKEEWEQVLLAIEAFPDEIETPRGGR